MWLWREGQDLGPEGIGRAPDISLPRPAVRISASSSGVSLRLPATTTKITVR